MPIRRPLRLLAVLLPLATACWLCRWPARFPSAVRLGPAGTCTVTASAAAGGET